MAGKSSRRASRRGKSSQILAAKAVPQSCRVRYRAVDQRRHKKGTQLWSGSKHGRLGKTVDPLAIVLKQTESDAGGLEGRIWRSGKQYERCSKEVGPRTAVKSRRK